MMLPVQIQVQTLKNAARFPEAAFLLAMTTLTISRSDQPKWQT